MFPRLLKTVLKLLLVLAFLVALAGFSAFATIRYIFATGDVLVPDLVKRDLVYAVDLLAERHLKLKVVEYRFDPQIAKDAILTQEPLPGAMAKKNSTIRVSLSKGTEASVIPDVLQKQWQDATTVLKQNKFRIGRVAYVHSSEAPMDHIIAQMPFPQSEARQGTEVDLLVSLGPYKNVMVMPDLVEEQLEYGLQMIGKLGLVLGKIERDAEFPVAPDTIISQIPKPGTLIQEQNIVNLVVSGPGVAKDPFAPNVLPVTYATIDYTVPAGRFDREVAVTVKNMEGVSELFRQILPPGRAIAVQIPVVGETVVEISLDGVLDEVRRVNQEQ